MQEPIKICSKTAPRQIKGGVIILAILLMSSSPLLSAQMAPMQLTNPSVDSIKGDKTAAWIADENMGVLYCELILTDDKTSKRVMCFDSNGQVTPGKGIMSNR